MGDAKRKKTATEKLIAEFPNCYFCGGQRATTTREHMPPKSLFDQSHRPDKLIMPACGTCNGGTSTADLTVSIISRWNYGFRSPDYGRLVAQMRNQAPELVKEWVATGELEREQAIHHLRKSGVLVPDDAGIATVGDLTTRQLNLFVHKATLALYFEHFRQPLPPVGAVCAFWRSKEDYALYGVPPILLSIFPHYATLVQGKWDERETFEYRYNLNAEEGLFGCIAKLRQGLFVMGLAVANADELPSSEIDWLHPADPSALLDCPRFQIKN
jgi:hypothetical protein